MPSLTRRELICQCAGAAALVGAAALPLVGCTRQRPAFVQRTLFNFDTVCVLGGTMDNDVLDEAQLLCERYEQLFSRTIETSDVARVNAAGGKPTEVDEQTAELVSRALAYCDASDGLFDITMGAVTELWDFAEGVVPSDQAIAEALSHVGWEQVSVRGTTVQLADPQGRMDLGGIAKGYITDKLMALFVRRGVQDAFVNLGGNVAVMGNNERGTAWSVGVRDPFDDAGANVVAKLSTTEGSLVTSGLYERSFEKDGRRYWHILDPRTGYPVQTDVVSASIFCTASIDGDGYTKPLFMLEPDEALAFLEEREGLQGLLVLVDGSMCLTDGAPFELV